MSGLVAGVPVAVRVEALPARVVAAHHHAHVAHPRGQGRGGQPGAVQKLEPGQAGAQAGRGRGDAHQRLVVHGAPDHHGRQGGQAHGVAARCDRRHLRHHDAGAKADAPRAAVQVQPRHGGAGHPAGVGPVHEVHAPARRHAGLRQHEVGAGSVVVPADGVRDDAVDREGLAVRQRHPRRGVKHQFAPRPRQVQRGRWRRRRPRVRRGCGGRRDARRRGQLARDGALAPGVLTACLAHGLAALRVVLGRQVAHPAPARLASASELRAVARDVGRLADRADARGLLAVGHRVPPVLVRHGWAWGGVIHGRHGATRRRGVRPRLYV